MAALILRGTPVVVAAILAGMFVYYLGIRLKWWNGIKRGKKPKLAAAKSQPAGSQRGGQHDDLPVTYSLVSDIWQECRIVRDKAWLLARDSTIMIRVHIVDRTLYIERIRTDAYAKRISDGYVLMELFVFVQGKDSQPSLCVVRVERGGPPYFDVPATHLALETSRSTGDVTDMKITDDTLRKLKHELQVAVATDDD